MSDPTRTTIMVTDQRHLLGRYFGAIELSRRWRRPFSLLSVVQALAPSLPHRAPAG